MSTLFTGANIIQLPTVDSTNNYALELLKDGKCFEGTVVWVLQQTEGRGQRGKRWDSTPGENLTFSVVYLPVFLAVNCQFRLSQAVSLAILDCLRPLFKDFGKDSKQIKIKWPNDIYIRDKKVAGILIENSVQQANLSSSIIGIGINTNQTDFPKELPNPTSLKLELGTDFELRDLLDKLCKNLEARYLQLKANQADSLIEEYLQVLYRLGEETQFIHQDVEITATIKGVNSEGMLLLETKDGQTLKCGMNEISMVI